MKIKQRGTRIAAAALAIGILIGAGATAPAIATGESARAAVSTPQAPRSAKPTIVLVHGAFADSSGWSVIGAGLQAAGYPVIAFSNPLRGVAYDSEYLRAFLGTIPGPIVLVGHSYGGAVITNAATGDPDVKSLVYIAAYALDQGETVQAANSLGGGHTELGEHLVIRRVPRGLAGRRGRVHRPCLLPGALRPGPASRRHEPDGSRSAAGGARRVRHAIGGPGVENDPQLVHGRQTGPHDPARGGTGDGTPSRCHHGRGELLPRGHDQQAARRGRTDPAGSEVTHPGSGRG